MAQTIRLPDDPVLRGLPGVSWGEWEYGSAGLVHKLVDAKRFELYLLSAGYAYQASQTFGRDQAKYWQITYRNDQSKEVHIRYQPEHGQPPPGWQLGWFIDRVWVNFGEPVAEWPRVDSESCIQARQELPHGARVDARPVFLHLPVDLAQLVAGHDGATWSAQADLVKIAGDADISRLLETLEAIGFERQSGNVYRDPHSGQRLSVMRLHN